MKKLNIGVFVLTAAIFVFMTGCGKNQDNASEKVTEGIVEKAVGGNVDITKDGVKIQKDGASFESGNDLKWPKEYMGDLPVPKAKISAVMNGKVSEGSTVVFSGMSLDDAKAYIEKLKELGYKDGMSIADTDAFVYSGKNSGGAAIMFNFNSASKEGSISYTADNAK